MGSGSGPYNLSSLQGLLVEGVDVTEGTHSSQELRHEVIVTAARAIYIYIVDDTQAKTVLILLYD